MVDIIASVLQIAADTLFNISFSENNQTNPDEPETFLLTVVLMTIVYAILFVTGVVGNICTCIVIAWNHYMHTPTNCYLFSLAISDLLLLIVNLPQEVYELWVPQPYSLGEVMCIIRSFTAETSTYASILTITSFSIERYIAICHPLKSLKGSSLSRAVKIIIIVWGISAMFAVPVSLQFGLLYDLNNVGEYLMDTAVCTLKNPRRHAFLTSSLLFFFIPQMIIFLLYVKIGLKLRSSSDTSTEEASASEANRIKREKHQTCNNRKGLIKMLVAVVVSFFFCCLPFHIQRLMAVYVIIPTPLFNTIYTVIRHISGVTYYLSPTVNPILYQVMSTNFQNAFKETFGPFCRRLSGELPMAELAPAINVNTECTQDSTRI